MNMTFCLEWLASNSIVAGEVCAFNLKKSKICLLQEVCVYVCVCVSVYYCVCLISSV